MSASTYLLHNWVPLITTLSLVYIVSLIIKFVRHRRFYIGLPTPPRNLLLGNLKVMGEEMKSYPPDFHPQPLFTNIGTKYNLRGIFYMDLYPFTWPMIFITDPGVAMQIQSDPNKFYRHPYASTFLGGLVGTKSIFSTQGIEWQHQRSWFAPAFSMSHLLTLIPGMIEETLVFKEKLSNYAVSKEVFSMNDAAVRLAIDVIGRSVGDIRLGSQTEDSPIYKAFIGAIWWTAGQTEPMWKKILSPYMMNRYTNKLDQLLGDVIKEKYRNRQDEGTDKSILDLALRGYLKDNGTVEKGKPRRADLDTEFMKVALDNAKTFFAGGHDTTASLITYNFYYLSTHPAILSRVREEQNEVFGSSLDSTISALKSDPHLINKLPLTNAVLKEVLRLHTAGFTVRQAMPGATVTFEGRTYPMDNHMIAVLACSMQRDPTWWKNNPNEFDPDRFLSPDTHSNAAWQPFEKGPRNCIGQQLSMLEAKVISVLTVRYFDFEVVFKPHGLSIPGWGGRAYQELQLTAKPKDGIPMRATVANA